MKQLVTDFAKGKTFLAEIPLPSPGPGELLIQSRYSLISTGTERMVVEFGRSSLIKKARSQPAKVKQVLGKVKTDGLLATYDAVRSKLSAPLGLGYCNAGVVIAVGREVAGFKPGDRVVSNGPHAEYFTVGKNLCAKIPENVPDETAAATVAAAIGLQGVRLAEPTLGESVAVIGTGLIGLFTVQILLANGCRVLAIDLSPERLDLAKSFGAETCLASETTDPVAAAMQFSRGLGMDAVLITTATQSNLPIQQSAKMARRNGRIVMTGVAGLNIDRDDFYKKEISFRVSCSYGPGRYDPNYEELGQDYPAGFVRWTEQRNFEAVLDMMAAGKIVVQPLVSQRFDFDAADKAYDALAKDRKSLAIMLKYGGESQASPSVKLSKPGTAASLRVNASNKIGFIGAGNYASRVLIPAFRKAGANLGTISSKGGFTASLVGQSSGFDEATTNTTALLADDQHSAIVVATRHSSHANFAASALQQGKHVFVEKPLALSHEQLDRIESAHVKNQNGGSQPLLMVGFNRRFSPFIIKMKRWLDQVQAPKAIVITVNAGAIPAESWVQEKSSGGGRIAGEACHFIDLLRHLAGSPIKSFEASAMLGSHAAEQLRDTATVTLRFASGTIGTIHYFANGNASYPKERVEIFAGGSISVLDNYRKLTGFGPGTPKARSFRQDKGQADCAKAFLQAIEGKSPPPIPFDEIMEVSRATIDIAAKLDAQE
jgi:predicted dehydrogenase